MIRLHKITSLAVDPETEIRKIIASGGRDRITADSSAMSQVYRIYRNMKVLGFFGLVAGRYGNTEAAGGMSLRVYDIFEGDTGEGRIFFIVEITRESLDAFLDDGCVLLKIREWLISCYRCVSQSVPSGDVVRLWDDVFSAPGSPLPASVKVVPFYNQAIAPGIPAVILILVA